MVNPKLTPERLGRRAIVYIRQSTPGQVLHNKESQLRQYALKDRAKELGFRDIHVIDDDLGRSASGQVERPGFQRLVAEVCGGNIGAILCIEASRLARNGRDWHYLIEMCGLIGAVIIDPDGIYDPSLINDRLLLGLKGTMSEFELNLFRQRSMEAIRQKAGRGELRFRLPAGYCWTANGKVEMDPDARVQQALRLVFTKMIELGTARQVLLWLHNEHVSLPVASLDELGDKILWKPPVYYHVLAILTNPMYAGAYVFGKTERRSRVVDGRARKSDGHRKPQQNWTVLLKNHHPGYITWEQFERNQKIIAENAHMGPGARPKAGRGGRVLLSGLLRCRRCGRMLNTWYKPGNKSGRYHCWGSSLTYGGARCIGFGSSAVDDAVSRELLRAVAGNAIEAAIHAAEEALQQRRGHRQSLELELEQARYEARRACRRYEAVDPDQRLVAGELEVRWNTALKRVAEIEDRLQQFDLAPAGTPPPDKALLSSLAQDLPAVWNAPTTEPRLKQRIVRILINEVVVDVDEEKHEVIMVIHWAGGRHSELRVPKIAPGRHSRCTGLEAVEVVRQMAGMFPDKDIAATLNRLRIRTGAGNPWTPMRVASMRCYHEWPAFSSTEPKPDLLTLEQTAEVLGICATTTRKLIDLKIIQASQVVPCAPWRIPREAIQTEPVRRAIATIKSKNRLPQAHSDSDEDLLFSTT
jgi:DNA invertase Pin-like site-specific DNA recombinase